MRAPTALTHHGRLASLPPRPGKPAGLRITALVADSVPLGHFRASLHHLVEVESHLGLLLGIAAWTCA